ncbi:D-amino-acid transaminase [Draconibacterium sp. IB214405]|uniref:D-amino-acid transaminase n=1 Tax=Draconibacterium sp. IB214405 TaxID=3097352 RepID=UPI002A133B67|nr:D-amino-acid transaminase [Draconibacterium sp. IB214405]MDX8339725.1 D-amino-acid transaminase [Draconibacterium sp. IB214405]
MSNIVYLNGDFINEEQASISPNDRGFLLADGVYEVAKYYNGKAFRYKDHLDRLNRSLDEIGIDYDTAELESVFMELISRNDKLEKHAGIYLQITRGTAKRSHHFPDDIKPTVYAYAFDLPSFTDKLENGIKVIVRDDIRWQRCDIKSVSLLPNTMLYNEAHKNGAGECILIRDGQVTEATHSSVLCVKNGVLVTRPLSNLILPGITRKVILELCATNNIPVEERLYTKEELYEMDEVFVAGTGSEICPVVKIEDKLVGNRKPGETTRLLQKLFFELV